MKAFPIIASLVGAAVILAWRMRETTRPVTVRKIVIPPLGMSTGFSMFAYAPTRIPLLWGLSSFALGALVFSYPLIKSSKLVRVGDHVMLHRSPAFLWILLGLVAVRFALRGYVEQYIDTLQTGSIFFVLAFGMIVTWRVLMFHEFRKLTRDMATSAAVGVDPASIDTAPRANDAQAVEAAPRQSPFV